MRPLAGRCARRSAYLELDDVPMAMRGAAHRAILDTIGVCAAGSARPKVQMLRTWLSASPEPVSSPLGLVH